MNPRTPPPDTQTDEEEKKKEDQRLDEELEETFPASDPIPIRHGG